MVKILEDLLKKYKEVETVSPDVETTTKEEPKEERRVIGKITKLQMEEGWGFISSKEIKFTRIFFHWSSLKQDTLKFPQLKTGMKVEFTPSEHAEKGTRAIKIKVIE